MKLTLPEKPQEIINTLKKAGFQAYAVGGCVRDLILKREIRDWDFTTNAIPFEIQKLFPKSFYNNQFGTVGIPVKQSAINSQNPIVIYEVTTYRSEKGYSDHRHPDKILWGETLVEDLKRRDFTINAIAFDGKKITDPFNGVDDIQTKTIKAVGDGKLRFREDALRMMRAIRLSTELQFLIDKNTFEAIKSNAKLILKISPERIRDELMKIIASDFPMEGIRMLKNSFLLAFIIPEFEKCFSVEQKSPKRHHIHDVGTHSLLAMHNCPSNDPIVRLATLLHDVGKAVVVKKTDEGIVTFYNHEIVGASIVKNVANRLRFSKKDRERLVNLVRFHQFSVDERQTDSAIRRILKNIGLENIMDMLALRTGDRLGGGARETSWRLELFKKRLIEVQKKPFSVEDLKVDGYDVMKTYGISPGPLVGAVLKIIFEEVVEGKLPNEKEILLVRINKLKKESKIIN